MQEKRERIKEKKAGMLQVLPFFFLHFSFFF